MACRLTISAASRRFYERKLFVSLHPPTSDAVELELRRACAELDRRLRAGEAITAEVILAEHPALAASDEHAVELVYAEIVAREDLQKSTGADEYFARFPQYRERLERLLKVHALLREGDEPSATPDRLAHYELIEELGRGGMGVVYKARDTKLGRLVALKVLLAGEFADLHEQARFEHEARAVAHLQHPSIVQIYESGEVAGRRFLAFELIDGPNLATLIRQARWPAVGVEVPQAAAELLRTVAQAVHYAHQCGIVHRDLKPANILLTPDGTPKVADFGLARPLEAQGATRTGAVVGTPNYMAPEQVRGESNQVGPAADVYALGAILYELLVGEPPFGHAGSFDTLARIVAEPPVSPLRIQPRMPRDLATICLVCLEKEPSRRYRDAAALAEDLQRFLRGEPIAARPASLGRRLAKWARRRPALAALVVVSGLATAALLAGSLVHNARLTRALDQAETLRKEAEVMQKRAERQTNEIGYQLDRSQRGMYALQLAQVQTLVERDPGRALELLEDPLICRPELRDFTWHYFRNLCDRAQRTISDYGHVHGLAYSPDGKYLAGAYGARVPGEPQFEPGWVRVWGLNDNANRYTVDAHHASLHAVAFLPDSNTIVAAGGGRKDNKAFGEVIAWDSLKSKELGQLSEGLKPILSLGVQPDGKVVVGSGEGTLRTWTIGSDKPEWFGTVSSARAFALLPEGRIAVAGNGRELSLWDLASKKKLGTLGPVSVSISRLAASPSGKLLAAADGDHAIALFDVPAEKQIARLVGHTNQPKSLAFSPDETWLASAADDYTVKLWDTQRHTAITTLKGHRRPVLSVAIAPDGKQLATGDAEGTIKLWSPRPIESPTLVDSEQPRVLCAAASPDGKWLATSGMNPKVRLWSLETGKIAYTLEGHKAPVRALAFSKTGLLATASEDRTVMIWNVETQQLLHTLTGYDHFVTGLAISPDDRLLATGGLERSIRLWNLADGSQYGEPIELNREINSLGFSPVGNYLFASCDNNATVLDVQTLQVVKELPGSAEAVAFHPDRPIVATAGRDMVIRLWVLGSWHLMAELPGHTHWINSLAFSPDGYTLASGTGDRWPNVPGEVKLWDPSAGHVRATLVGHSGPVVFTSHGRQLVIGANGGTLTKLNGEDKLQ